MTDVFIFISIIFIASILQTSTGFGFSIMATPFLLLLFQPDEAIQINLILSLLISLALVWKIRTFIDIHLMRKFITGSLAGVPVGIFIFMTIDDLTTFKIVVSVLLLALTVLLLLKFRIKRTPFRDYLIGGISGMLTTSIGMPGPPLLLYFTGTGTKKEVLRATTLAFYLFIYLISLMTQLMFSGTTREVWESSLYAIPLVALGLLLGQILFNWINQQIFTIFTYVLLSFTGIYLLIESIFF
ncbi:sulfite exporter TauE/SafE family protein [Bacillus sp. Marseille-Q1617]|uniref:sulfite exporter TauE/SafE family protein n=1 Tax=Bacillus sp. Marseille-Q1617 TaxID=2736887 RepID=UPI00158BAE8E|nr:sulfite exporter TauE/SafE family protein [Bacillus sp. Marseille-Q1617]